MLLFRECLISYKHGCQQTFLKKIRILRFRILYRIKIYLNNLEIYLQKFGDSSFIWYLSKFNLINNNERHDLQVMVLNEKLR